MFFYNVDKVELECEKFKKTDKIKKFHISYTIRLFFFFHRFSFLALFQLQKHYQWDLSLDALVKVA